MSAASDPGSEELELTTVSPSPQLTNCDPESCLQRECSPDGRHS